MKAVAYTWVHTDGPMRDGHGLAIQEKAVKEWALTNWHRIIRHAH